MEKKILIQTKDLVKKFGEVEVLKSLSIHFFEGDRVALIGQNGAGKTTLIRCILGLYTFQGDLKVLKKHPRIDREYILNHVGFVPQIPPPLKMTVAEILSFFSRIFHVSQENFIEVANALNLEVEKHLNKPFLKLSGGMKQKLLIGLALGRNPKILLMDEPAANLDPEARTIFFDMLSNYRKDSLMIISSHRTDEIEHLINRVVEMDLGKIVVDKPFEKIISS